MISRDELQFLQLQGITLPSTAVYAQDAQVAMDAQPVLVTTPNVGIPWALSNIVDPEVIRVLVTPMKAAVILGGETKKGDWTTLTAQFPIAELTGFTTSYGDYNNNGNVGANFNWTPRQSYNFQTVIQYGEREVDMYGAARIAYTNELNMAAALVMAKFLNKTYFFGVAGMQNYGLLNDPSLTTPLTPATKAATGTAWTNATPPEVNTDIQALYSKLQTQMGGNLDLSSPMVLAMSPATEVFLLNTNLYGVSTKDLLKKNFPNLRIETAPEYATQGGNLVQLILESVDGVRTGYAAFNEKMRSHPVIPDLSSYRQKKSGGTWGTIIRRPLAIAQMLGV